MTALRLSRRGLFGGFAALLAAPAIVRVASIMPVKAMPPDAWGADAWYRHRVYRPSFEEMVRSTLEAAEARLVRDVERPSALARIIERGRLRNGLEQYGREYWNTYAQRVVT